MTKMMMMLQLRLGRVGLPLLSRWGKRIFIRVVAFILFLILVYFVREIVHEAFNPVRQPGNIRQVGLMGGGVLAAMDSFSRRL